MKAAKRRTPKAAAKTCFCGEPSYWKGLCRRHMRRQFEWEEEHTPKRPKRRAG